MKGKFRFEDLEIWKLSIEIADMLFDIADEIEKKGMRRFAEQLRGAGISMPNNIAEGSGSIFSKEFVSYLNMARRSTFENANMVMIYARRKLISSEKANIILSKLGLLCRKITSFQRTLK